MSPALWVAASIALAAPGAPQSPLPSICDPDEPKHCAAPLQRGQAAPFDGQLLTPELAITLGLKADQCDERLRLEVEFCKRTADLERNYNEYVAEVDEGALRASHAACQKQLATALEVPLFERPWVVAAVSVAATLAIGSFAVWGAGQLR